MKLLTVLLVFSILFASSAIADCRSKFCIGMILPLSGPVGEYGNAIRNGIWMAQRDAPDALSNIEFMYEDSEYKPARGISSLKKLVLVDGAHLTYTFGGTVSEVVAPVGQQLKAATLISSVNPSAKLGRSFVLRFSNPAIEFSALLAKELKRISARKIQVVLTENHYLNALVKGLEESLEPDQTLEVLGSFQPGDMDFKSMVSSIARNTPDALGILLLPGQVSQFYRDMRAQQVSVPTFGSDVFESRTEIAASQGGMEGAFIAHHVVDESFRTAYAQRFGNDFQIAYAGQGYDLANLLAVLFRNAPEGLKPDAVLTALRSAKAFKGVMGTIEFASSKNGDEYFSFPIALRRVVKGEMKTVR